MHKFERGEPPPGLDGAARRYDNVWTGDFACSDCHACVRDTLYERQNHCCAYCDILLHSVADGHIEHLERRRDAPQRTFDWANLFFSCCHSDSCGVYKDDRHVFFNPADIVDPSREDPIGFFRYDVSGAVHANPTASPEDQHRAEETIRVFNLNCPRLQRMRANVAMTLTSCLLDLKSDKDIRDFLQAVSASGFQSVYRSLLKA